jgi:two-component system, LytTR family, response regulator
MTAILIDDDPECNFVLQTLLQKTCPQVTILSTWESPAEGGQAVLERRPDLLFLDVEMPGETGFELLQRIKPDCEVIFVTAFEKYALQALNLSAAHYLLKPVEVEDLAEAVEKARRFQEHKTKLLHYDLLQEIVEQQKRQQKPRRILLPDAQQGYELIHIKDICFLEADRAYTRFHLIDKRIITASKNMGSYQRDLGLPFFRSHHSYLINTEFIRFVNWGEDKVVMQNGDKLPLTRGIKDDLMKHL